MHDSVLYISEIFVVVMQVPIKITCGKHFLRSLNKNDKSGIWSHWRRMLSGISCSYKTCLQFVRQKLHYNIKIINIHFVFTSLTF